jgi:hypothetical protein
MRIGDGCDGPVNRLGCRLLGRDGDDDAFGSWLGRLGVAYLDVVNAAVDRIDNKVVTVREFVGKTPSYDAADHAITDLFAIVDHQIHGIPVDLGSGELLVQGLDDVSALAHPAKDGLQALIQAPLSRGHFLCETEASQLLQPPGTEGLAETVLIAPGSNGAVGFHLAKKAAVEASEALLFDFCSEAGLDFVIGARAKVDCDNLGGTFSHSPAEILARDDEVFTLVILAA